MAGVLDFKLGMATSGFLGPLGGANAAFGKFLGIGTAVAGALGAIAGVGGVVSGVLKEIGEGGRMFDLGGKLRESVSGLFALEFALDQVGEASSSAGPLVTQINKALGGFNEMGEPTKDVFKAIGLSADTLKKMDAAKRFKPSQQRWPDSQKKRLEIWQRKSRGARQWR